MSEQYRNFKRIVKIHTDTADYYQRCGKITTEADLTELFTDLSELRVRMANALLSALPEEERKGFWRVQEALSYLQRIWYNVKIALIVNDRSKILKYCQKTELDAWHDYDKAIRRQETSEDLFRLATAHQQLLKEMIARIENTPIKKFHLQKELAA